MTNRTTIRIADHPRHVELIYTDAMGERIRREFWISAGDGHRYIREGDRQVCAGLSRTGNTLTALDDGTGADLMATIRREWRQARKWAMA